MGQIISFSWINTNILFLVLSLAIVSNSIISLFYSAFKLKWPDLYFSVNDMAAFFISVSLKRYLAFRFIPVFLILTVVLGVFMKDQSISIATSAGMICMGVHALLSNGKAIYDLLKRSKNIKIYFNIAYQISLHVITFIFLIILGFLSGFLSKTSFVNIITPTIQGLTDNIWSALLTVILIEYLRLLYTEKSIDIEEVIKRSKNNIEPDIFKMIDYVSIKFRASPTLLKAICIIENIQRPKWVRKIENIKSFLRQTGTYGIMQVKSSRPISDLVSIEIAAENFFADTADMKSYETIAQKITNYNDSVQYRDLVIRAINYLDPLNGLYESSR